MASPQGYVTTTDHGRQDGVCAQCGVKMGAFLGTKTEDGRPIHNECVPNYRRATVERCAHCDQPLLVERIKIKDKKTGEEKKLHPACVDDYKAERPYEPPEETGYMTKMACGRSRFFGLKNWKKRFFVINKRTGGLLYYEDEQAYRSGKPPKNMAAISKASRMITKPTRFIHQGASSENLELIIVFQEGGKELRLLVRADDYETKMKWQRTLSAYIKDIDNPVDLKERFS